jgi:hypothetical protein
MMIRRLLLTLLLAQIALSQGGEAGSIQGAVVNGYTGLPFPGATVELLGVQHGRVLSRTVRTDSKGEFQFPNVPPGSGYQLLVTGERLLATAYGQNSRNEPWVALTLEPGEALRDLRINVQPQATIRGRVVDNQGRGLFGARVVALTPTYRSAHRTLQISSTQVTNSRGDYQFSSMPAGVYYLRVTPTNSDPVANTLLSTPSRFDRDAQGTPIGSNSNPEGLPVTYYPSTVDVEFAKPVNLGAGGDADNTDITVTRVKTGRVRGVVTYDGATVLTGQVVLQREGTAAESSWTRIAEIRDGQFDIRAVLPGAYVLWTRSGEGAARLWGRTTVNARGGETSITGVKVSPAPDIPGRLAIEGWTDLTAPDFTQLAVVLFPRELLPVDLSLPRNDVVIPAQSLTVSGDGQFTLHGVQPWDYRVMVRAAGSTLPNASSLQRLYVKSIRNRDSDIADKGLQLGSIFDGGIDILLSMDSGGLDGRVLEAGRDSGGAAQVVLVPEARHRHDLYFALMASATGRFQLQGIPPGSYKVFAWKDALSGSWYDPDFLNAYEERGLPVQIAPGSAEYVELKRLP